MQMMLIANPSLVRLACSGHTVQLVEKAHQKAIIVTILVIVSGVLGSGFQEEALGAAKDKQRGSEVFGAGRYIAGWRGWEWRNNEC